MFAQVWDADGKLVLGAASAKERDCALRRKTPTQKTKREGELWWAVEASNLGPADLLRGRKTVCQSSESPHK